MWHHGEILTKLGWKILVQIPKGNTNTLVVGLLETPWKVVEAIIDTHLRAIIIFHEFLHGFPVGRVMGTDIMELKIA